MKKKVLFILMPKQFQDLEFNTPYVALTAHHHVDIAGLQPGNALGELGIEYTPNKLLANMTPQDLSMYDALVIPGGQGAPTYLWGNTLVHNVLSQFHGNKKLICLICNACDLLLESGILDKNRMNNLREECVVDTKENLITVKNQKLVKDFADAVLKALE